MIHSLLDTDLYKFTMMQCVLHHFPQARVEYQFKCRNQAQIGPYLEEIRSEIKALCRLQFSLDELHYLSTLRYLTSDFIEFLRIFKLNIDFVTVFLDPDQQLAITIRGPWLHTILFEVPILAIVNEVYYRYHSPAVDLKEGERRLSEKIAFLHRHDEILGEGFYFSDFGTRRRFSAQWQGMILERLHEAFPTYFIGTSNVHWSYRLGLTPVGTMAHEFLQACQAVGPRLVDSQKYALEVWAREYRGYLGIALTDVISMDAFLNDFDLFFAKLFDGLRHDSGDPFIWGEKAIAHYLAMGIDPRTKKLTFSDALDFKRAVDIYQHFKARTQVLFGIGTYLTNDLGASPLQIVIKMIRCNDQPVAKLSDTPGKTMCPDPSYVEYLRAVFEASMQQGR
jgi:nicotinate phosphoribosyltransferase